MDKALTSWPLAATICVVFFFALFRGSIGNFIDRCRRLGFGDKSIDLSDTSQKRAAQQQQQIEAPLIEGATVPASHAMPPPNELYAGIENELKNALKTASVPAEVERAWLLRGVAIARIERAHEIVYRTILGSQINLLLQANTASLPDKARAQQIYEAAKVAFPHIYAEFDFDTWLNYPLNVGLIKKESFKEGTEVLTITLGGRDFLNYLVNCGLTYEKAG